MTETRWAQDFQPIVPAQKYNIHNDEIQLN